MSLPANESIIKTIAEHLRTEINDPDILILEEWPSPGYENKDVTISVTTIGDPEETKFTPSPYSQIENVDDPTKLDTVYLIGQFNLSIQIDVWTDYKTKRNDWFQKIEEIFDQNFMDTGGPTGISLTMIDYLGAIARYEQVGYNYSDSEESSQRSEWRIRFSILTHFPKLRMKTEPKITEAGITSDVGSGDPDENNEENKQVY